MNNKRVFKIVVYIMLFAMVGSALLATIGSLIS